MNKKFFILAILGVFLTSLIVIIGASEWKESLNNNLEHYYNFNFTSSETYANDSVGNWNLSVSNSWIVEGKYGNAFQVNDTQLNTEKTFAGYDGLTLNWWQNSTQHSSGVGVWWITNGLMSGTGQIDIFMSNNLKSTTFRVYDDNELNIGTVNYEYNVYNMITITVNSTSASLYLNGSLNSTQTLTDFVLAPAQQIWLWGFGGTNDSIPENISMDEFGIWNRSLTQEEITHLFLEGVGTFPDQEDTTNPNLTIESPTGIVTSKTISIQITAQDTNLESCYFNITRGASLEVGHTKINNCEYASTVVSSDGDYIIWVIVNDSVGYTNTTNSNFSVDTSTIVSSQTAGGGGGGARIPILQMITPTPESICIGFKSAFQTALEEVKEKSITEKISLVWNEWWDFILCESASAIVPI